MSILLVLVMVLSLMPATAFAADPCSICGNTDGTHKETCRFSCPTEGCTVSDDGKTYVHSDSTCPYSDSRLYCTECGYLSYNAEEDDYFHSDGCSIGYPDKEEEIEEDKAPDPIAAQQYTADGVTYFGVDSDNFDKSSKLFIQDMLSSKNDVLDEKSTAALWQYLAFCIQDDNGRGTSTGKFKNQFDNVIPNGLAYNTGSTGIYSANKSSGDNKYNVYSSGLVYANSMSAAAEAMETQMFSWYRSSGGGRKDKYGDANDAAIAKNSTLWNDTDVDDIFWMVTGAYKTSGTNKKGHYQALGILFSDFTITTILPGDSGNFYQSTTSESDPSSSTYASDVKNSTGVEVSAQQEISSTTSTTATSSISGSNSYGFEECLEIGYEHGFLGGKVHANISFTASQTIEKGWSEEESLSEEETTSFNVSVPLPPYTNVMIKQSTGEVTTTTKYNCPVALNFTVTIVDYTLDPSSNNAGCKTQVLATFGANARKNLNQRGVIEYTLTDPEGIVWGSLYNNHNDLQGIIADKLTGIAPMASAGATFTVVEKTVSTEISGLAPIYALSTVKTANDVMEYYLTTGESLYVDNIALEGLNAQNAAYYGFNPDKGHWILVDENGETLTDSSIAKLETNSVTGYTKLVAGQEEGTIYLKYLIDEDCYATAENPTRWTKNADLASTAIILVNVSAVPFVGNIGGGGTLNGAGAAYTKGGATGLTFTTDDTMGGLLRLLVLVDGKAVFPENYTESGEPLTVTLHADYLDTLSAGEYTIEIVTTYGSASVKFTVRNGGTESPTDTYNVTFDTDGGSAVAPQLVKAGDYAVRPDTNPRKAGYTFRDWYQADKTTTFDFDTYAITADTTVYAVRTKNYVPSHEPTPRPKAVTIPVSGEDMSVNVTVQISGKTATIQNADIDRVLEAKHVGTVVVDLSGLKDTVTQVVIPGELLIKTTDAAANEDCDADGLEIKLPGCSVAFDADALAAVTEQTDGKALTLTLTVVKPTELSSAQRDAVKDLDVQLVLDFKLAGNGYSISDFKDGTATFKVPYELKDGQSPRGIVVWYVSDDGERTEVPSTYDSKNVVFTVPHFSNYIMAYDVEKVAECPKDDTCPLSALTDLDLTLWYYDGIHFCLENGMMNGVGNGKFDPSGTTNRAMIVTILYRSEGKPEVTGKDNPFGDVENGKWYTDAVIWAVENKIVEGYGDGKFGPMDIITREQLAAILYRYAQSKGQGFTGTWYFPLNYPDNAEISDWADEAMHWCVMNQIINGKDGKLVPGGDASRAEAATMLMRYCTKIAE